MIDHFALSVYSAWIRAGRPAFLIDASEIPRALAVHYAFSLTVGGIAHKVGETGTNGETIYVLAFAIWSAGGRAAGVCRDGCVKKNIVIGYILCVNNKTNMFVCFIDRHH
jgi:hypothetical protein